MDFFVFNLHFETIYIALLEYAVAPFQCMSIVSSVWFSNFYVCTTVVWSRWNVEVPSGISKVVRLSGRLIICDLRVIEMTQRGVCVCVCICGCWGGCIYLANTDFRANISYRTGIFPLPALSISPDALTWLQRTPEMPGVWNSKSHKQVQSEHTAAACDHQAGIVERRKLWLPFSLTEPWCSWCSPVHIQVLADKPLSDPAVSQSDKLLDFFWIPASHLLQKVTPVSGKVKGDFMFPRWGVPRIHLLLRNTFWRYQRGTKMKGKWTHVAMFILGNRLVQSCWHPEPQVTGKQDCLWHLS